MSDKTIEVTDTSLLEGTNGKPPEQDVAMRESVREYVLGETGPEHHGAIRRLYEAWESYNEDYYASAMVVPLIFLTTPSTPRRYADCGPVSGFGCTSQIRIRESLPVGTHPHMRREKRFREGRARFVDDILLHEMIHQFHQEISGERDESYHGHGPAFSAKANEIGEILGLPAVGRTCKKRDHEDRGLQSPSQWPHNVRDEAHYQGAYVLPTRDGEGSAAVPYSRGVFIPAGDVDLAMTLLRGHPDVDELCKRLGKEQRRRLAEEEEE